MALKKVASWWSDTKNCWVWVTEVWEVQAPAGRTDTGVCKRAIVGWKLAGSSAGLVQIWGGGWRGWGPNEWSVRPQQEEKESVILEN